MHIPFLMDSLQKVQPVFKQVPLTLALVGCVTLGALAGCDEKQAVYQPAVSKLLEKAQALKHADQPQEALCRLKAAEDIAPETYQVQYNLGILLTEQNQNQAAITHLEHALKLKPDDPNTLYTLGVTYHSLGDDYNLALHPPEGTEAPQSNAMTANLSREELESKRQDAYQNALKTYDAFLEKAPASDPGRKDIEAQREYLKPQLQ